MWNASGTLTDPAGGVTTRTYTATDQVASVTDPLGRVTTATYAYTGNNPLNTSDPTGLRPLNGADLKATTAHPAATSPQQETGGRRTVNTSARGPPSLGVWV